RVVEGFDPEPIPRQQQPPPPPVPDREGEHPPQLLHAALALLFVEVKNGLCVGSRLVAVPPRFQLGPEDRVVVQFTVVGNPDGAVLVGHGLMGTASNLAILKSLSASNLMNPPTVIWFSPPSISENRVAPSDL